MKIIDEVESITIVDAFANEFELFIKIDCNKNYAIGTSKWVKREELLDICCNIGMQAEVEVGKIVPKINMLGTKSNPNPLFKCFENLKEPQQTDNSDPTPNTRQ